MRLRNVKNANIILQDSSYFISDPKMYRQHWREMFACDNPIRLEVGCGKGQFLIQMAQQNPEINFVGVEKYESVLVRAIQNAELTSLPNLKFICVDAKELVQIFDHEIELLYLNFSDPWPKKRHHKRRLTSFDFLSIYESVFQSDSHIIQKTDNIILFASSLEDLSQFGYKFLQISLDLHQTDLPNIRTEYEQKFANMGVKINYVEAIKLKNK
ncbi:MAG: tRNA (guanosine(46)-N7)-methyltransferase TrmB [Bacilli bacterium]|nr:tRNA (guanosine(46)-N7)-methyltransferase TrmB [Bacilli bacterium]